MSIIATPANMKRYYADGVFAWSPNTREEYSATPGDYWHVPEDDPIRDANGDPMVLVVRETRIIELEPN